MLERLGLKKIVTANTGEQGIEILSRSNFDIVLCDYDLGRTKDGLQVLEEAKHREIIQHANCFIMITAVQTGEMVMGAIEYQPDAYIVKPITFDDLRLRLERVLNVKGTYYEILKNLDQKNFSGALTACDSLIKARPKLSPTILKHKAKIFLDTKAFAKAEAIYGEILQIRKLPWAYFGLAKAYFEQNKLPEAEKILENLITQNSNYTTAYDLLATIKDLIGDKKGAQKVLQAALRYSPRAIRRQTYLSRLATENQDWNIALLASRRGVELGRYSCFKSADNYIHLSAALQPQLRSESPSERRLASAEIFKTMDSFRKDFHNDTNALVSAHFIEGSTHKQLGQLNESERFIQLASQLIDKRRAEFNEHSISVLSQRISLACDFDILQYFINSDICKNLPADIKQEIEKNSQLKDRKAAQDLIDNFNNKGVEFFERGALVDAIQMFEKAIVDAAAGYSVLLNAMQAHIAFLELHGKDANSIEACINLITRLDEMPETDRRYARKKRLETIFTNLKSEW